MGGCKSSEGEAVKTHGYRGAKKHVFFFSRRGEASVAYYYSNRKTWLLQSAFGLSGRQRIGRGSSSQGAVQSRPGFTNEGSGTSWVSPSLSDLHTSYLSTPGARHAARAAPEVRMQGAQTE